MKNKLTCSVKLICTFIFFLFTSVSAQAITWTYYDINNNALVNPTDDEIDKTSVMRASDTGLTQYKLEISHDFSGTWGTGYLENIGNPYPEVGKHWKNLNEEIICNVDGIVPDTTSYNSRYIAAGYYAQGPPNTIDKANALLFDGVDDYVSIDGINIDNPTRLEFIFWAKRDRTNQEEWMMSHPSYSGVNPGFYIGFDQSDMATLGTASHGFVKADRATDTGWYQWKFVIEYYPYPYHNTTGQGVKLYIYRDGVELAQKTIEPDHWGVPYSYQTTDYESGCYVLDMDGQLLGGDDENYNSQWSECQEEWGRNFGDYSDGISNGHPLQICAEYGGKFDLILSQWFKCDRCYPKGEWVPESVCKTAWWGQGMYHYKGFDRYNGHTYKDVLTTKLVPVTKTAYNYDCQKMQYVVNGPIILGRGYISTHFQGQMKDIEIRQNGMKIGKWDLNDGNSSTLATDTSGNNHNGALVNFDQTKCWIINPELTKYYKNTKIQERQSIPKFKMTGPAKITYDWSRQHAVVVNTLPDTLRHLVSIQVIDDETQSNQSTSGKYWYNHSSTLVIRSGEDQCQKLSGYKDNVSDPNQTVNSNEKHVYNLDHYEDISWVYSPHLFEETVTIGSPVLLSNLPPDLLQRIDLTKKPRYISTDISETDMCYWNYAEKRLFPLRGDEIFDLEYDLNDSECVDVKVIVRIKTKWPEIPHAIHIAKTPPVNLDPQESDDVTFMDINYAENNAVVVDKKFSATEKGRSVLHFMRNYIQDTLPKEISLSFSGYGYAETEPIGLSETFTIEFFAKRRTNDNSDFIIGQGIAALGKSLIIGFENNKFVFHYYGAPLTTPLSYTNTEWHHWACVYETDTSEMNDDSGTIDTQSFSCKNNPDNYLCKWDDNKCYTEDYSGDYEVIEDQRYWNPIAKAKRRCGNNIQYKRKIYCDGNLVAETSLHIPYKGYGNIRVGMLSFVDTVGFKGQIDDVRIWDIAKSKDEIVSQMNSRLVGDENHLKAYFRMDKIGASYLEDNRINQTHSVIATLKNMDPSNSWIVDTDKLFSLEPAQIPVLGTTCIRVVETKGATENTTSASSLVGYEIKGKGMHDSRVPHNGYVFFENVPYNTTIYNRQDMQGAIYPVNTKNPDPDGRDKILVIWYRLQDGVSWPYQPAEYVSKWPNGGKRIVIASRLGSDGKNAEGEDQVYPDINNEYKNYLDPARYQNIEIYNQPNPMLPGYNPNEEHAIVTSSFRHSAAAPCPFAAYALRNDLNITETVIDQMPLDYKSSDYTSEPYVLLQYYDTVMKNYGMIPFKVETLDINCGYTFDYLMKAGDPVVAPYPLNEVIGATPPAEIFGKNATPDQLFYWKDHKGQSWAISGNGHSVEIADAVVNASETDHVDYKLTLKSEELTDGQHYLLKVSDNRGVIGLRPFVVGSLDTTRKMATVYVNGGAILGGNTFIVTIKQDTNTLTTSNFQLYNLKSTNNINVYYWYPLQPSFWWGKTTPGDSTGLVGLSIPWLPDGQIGSGDGFPTDMISKPKAIQVTYSVVWPDNVPVLKAGETLTFPGGEYRADHTEYPGLSGILGWATGQVVYDSLNPALQSDDLFNHYLVRLIPALIERQVDLPIDQFPEDLKPASNRVEVVMNNWYFKELHAGLKKRIYYDSSAQKLCMRGYVNDKTIGDDTLTASPGAIYVLQPNILTDREVKAIKAIEGADNTFKAAVDQLFEMTNNPSQFNNKDYSVGLDMYKNCLDHMIASYPKQEKYLKDMFDAWLGAGIADDRIIPQISYGPGLAVVPNGALLDPNNPTFSNFSSGYITLAQNNHPDMGALPVSLQIIKVVKDKVRGAIKTVYSDNVFDEKITLRHSADFGGNPDDLFFQWWYREEDGTSQQTPEFVPDKWLIFPDPSGQSGLGMSEISLAGAGAVLLVDNLFYVRYRHQNSNPDDAGAWSQWAGAANSKPDYYRPQLAEGWVKRVMNGINPFEARIKNFNNIDNPATYVSMIQQAGARYEGDVPFNPDKDVIENVGLIELYQTVLNRAMNLSINLEQPTCTSGIVSALLLSSSRISGFYNLLGNEAYTDALDPTIGFGSDSVEYGSLAPTIYAFMNQVPDLLEEELSLLRGKSETGARPAYNRLMWNFTKEQGEAAYALSYNIQDMDRDGLISVEDGRIMFPQGHGDAWGHYLTALKVYYNLLGNPYFNWESRSELFSVQGVVMDVDYFDERKFSEAAASKSKIGTEIVNLTYRSKYVENPEGQWQGYKDTNSKRAWGVSGWGRRTVQGAYIDWVMANAILPSHETFKLTRQDIDKIKEFVPFDFYSHLNEFENRGYPTKDAFLAALKQVIGDDQVVAHQELLLKYAAKEGLKRVDRTTVPDLSEIASQASQAQMVFDNANTGLNPSGLASGVVPFDIDPTRLIPGAYNAATHFEQVYERVIDVMDNARVIFDHANDLKNRIRQVATETEEFTEQTLEQDRDYRNRLIEIFGTPYEGTIGSGKPYPPGYKGPDYYYFNYIDVNEVSEETVVPASETMSAFFKPMNMKVLHENSDAGGQDFSDLPTMFTHFFDTDLDGASYMSTDFSEAVEIEYPISANKYSFHAPENWGVRRSPGEIQVALIELVIAESNLELALADYSGLMGEIEYSIGILNARSELQDKELRIGDDSFSKVRSFNDRILTRHRAASALEVSADAAWNLGVALAGGLPTSVGVASDPSFGARGIGLAVAQTAQMTMQGGAVELNYQAEEIESEKELYQFTTDTNLQKAGYKYDIQEQLKDIEGLLGSEAPTRLAIFKAREEMRQVTEKYRAVLEKGHRLLEERKAFNAKVAAKTQGNRYMDMTFRLNLNDALSKYRSMFDLATRYVYMAAKVYDYETNLSDRDPASAQLVLTDIIRQRTLGQYQDGEWVVGRGGLGDILSWMKINYNSLKGQMGFNNPQTETGRFSLRQELFRIKGDADNDSAFREELKTKQVDNLWAIPEFRKFCRPFVSENAGEQPGIVIEFQTNVLFGKNFFGWPLGGGDHAYDPSNFVTKVRSVGLWFDGYDSSLLSETPRAYLIPVGMDVMLVPNSDDLDTREWTIIDQKLPIPLPIRDADLNNPNWIPGLDSLNGSMTQIRRYSSFRAYHDDGYFSANQVNYDSRLVGRSVWNTRWMIIIPGGTFHYDQKYGLNTFIDTVKDIKLFFQTYAISGN